MKENNLLEDLHLCTQTIESVKALAEYLGIQDRLPETIQLAGSVRLTLSSKRDAYYVTTSQGCSCKAGQYSRMCKHRKASKSEIQRIPDSVISDPVLAGYDGPCSV